MGAGVAHTKLLAKLCSGLNKPNKQTVVPQNCVAALLHDLPLEKLRGLGGSLGQRVQSVLGLHTVGMHSPAHSSAQTVQYRTLRLVLSASAVHIILSKWVDVFITEEWNVHLVPCAGAADLHV
jgi:nucleotidyltransferase/DNA polymerase involved in DNA repair